MTDAVLDSRRGVTLVSALAGVAGLAGSFAVTGATPAFLASPVERTLARSMPGAIVSFAITTLGSLGQQLNLVTAVAVTGLLVALAARAALLTGEAANNRLLPAVGTAVLTWVVALALTRQVVLAAAPALAAAGVVAVAQTLDAAGGRVAPVSSKRRRALSTVGVALGATALGYTAGQRRTPTATAENAPSLDAAGADNEDIEAKLATAEARTLDVGGLEPLVSDRFFEVDINAVDPDVAAADWSLSVTGAVEREVTVDYEELLAMEAENRFSTLRCVGDSLNGKKMDTALWTGVPVERFLEEAGVDSDCECVMLRAEDDYYEEFPLEALRGGLLVYGMNGDVLPRGHGYPVRALVPGHWGEVNVKWLSEIELLEREATGYWEKRGWQGTGPVKPIAKLHHARLLNDGRRELAGHAYGGLQGVSAVEVSTDGGDTWADADLSEPLPAPDGEGRAADAWRQWQFAYDAPGQPHEVVVRMIDERGVVQTEEETGPRPSGPTGWVSRRFDR
ncbi:molybdopterin-dependent oxidoreductase [Haloarcula litorea]|uniref:molybdopterin-dependent oxidoreductase n=1 Tax=Haloarcula litorea TaxID=3032579 RepID=UPI0023E8A74B|nr:molybdopterin-dependent oxidoreductase [Halomicroarcula sp. GDY20]